MQASRKRPELLVAALGLAIAGALLLWAGLGERTARQAADTPAAQSYTVGGVADPFAAAPPDAPGTQGAAQPQPGDTPPGIAPPGETAYALPPEEDGAPYAPNEEGIEQPPPEADPIPQELPGETVTQKAPVNAAQPTSPPQAQVVVHINSASSAQLQTLKGIGPAKAQAIIDYRDAHGGFKDVMELLEVKGIGPATLEGMLPWVAL